MTRQIGITATEFPNTSIEEIFEKAREYKAETIELVQKKNINLEDVKRVKQLVSKYGIKIASVNNYFSNLAETTEDKIKEAQNIFIESIEMAYTLGAKFIVTYCFCEKIEDLDIYIKNLQPCLSLAKERDIIFALENEPSGITRTGEGILHIITSINSPYFKINYDPDNFYNGGEEGFPYAYEMIKKHIVYIHAKDSVRYNENLYGTKDRVLHRAIDAICVSLGEGALNWEGIAKRLKEDNFVGPIIIEPHTIPEKLDDTFSNGIRYLREKGL